MYTGTRLMRHRASEKTCHAQNVATSSHDHQSEPIGGTSSHDHQSDPIGATSSHDHQSDPIGVTSSHDHQSDPIGVTSSHDHQSDPIVALPDYSLDLKIPQRLQQKMAALFLTLDHWPASLKVIVLKSLDEGDRGSIGRGLFQMKG